MARLEIRFPDRAVETKKLVTNKSFVIGTDPASDFVVSGQGMEAKHATIRWADRRYRLEVAPSVKNVFSGVNPVSQLRLKPDAEFSVGNIEFRIRYDQEELGAIQSPTDADPARPPAPLYLSKPFLGILGGLLVLAALSVGLYFLVRERAANQQFQQAVKDMRDKLYPETIKGFDRFIESFPDDPRVDQAIYLRAQSRVLPLVEAGGSSLESALAAADQWVEEAGNTKEFAEHPTEIGDVILSLARKLAEQSRDRANPEPLALSEKAMALLARAIPADQQPTDEINRFRAVQEEARLAVTKGDTIEKTLAELDKSLADRSPARTYEQYRTLIHRYPDLRGDRRVRDRLQQAATMERELVRFDANLPPVKKGTVPLDASPGAAVVRRASSSTNSGPIVLAQVGDILYGIDSGTGQIPWRSVVGEPSAFPPSKVPYDASLAIVYRSTDNAVVLIDMITGKERTRLELGSARPAPATDVRWVGNQLWMVCSPGPNQPANLVVMTEWKGDQWELIGSIVFPQEIAAAPEFDTDRRAMLAVAKESTLYSVAIDRRQVEQVYSLGHEAGAISLRPILAGRFLFITETKGLDASVLRCLVIKKEDGSIAEIASQPIVGRLDDPPAIRAGRLFWASNRGECKVFELGAETDPVPWTAAASLTDFDSSSSIPTRLVLINDSEFWVLSSSAKKYRLVVEKKELQTTTSLPLVGPARRESRWELNRLITLASDPIMGGLLAQGWTDENTGPSWSTQIGWLPTAFVPAADASKVTLDSPTGPDTLSAEEIAQGITLERSFDWDARRRMEPTPASHLIDRDEQGSVSLVGRALRRVFASGEVKKFNLPSDAGGQIGRLETGLLVPSITGYLYWISIEDGKERSDPFAAPYIDSSPLPLRGVCVTDVNNPSAPVWTGGKNILFQIELSGQNTKLWQEKTRLTLPMETDIREIYVDGSFLWIVTPSQVTVVETAKKEVVGSVLISLQLSTARVVDGKLLAVDAEGQLVGIARQDGKPTLSWRSTFESTIVPDWILDGTQAMVALADGERIAIDIATGQPKDRRSLGRSLYQGPIRWGTNWIGLASDGSIVVWP
ncbi:PQQ-binding-like beta-propeller repeat protein [bacterium]|nr:PQQ-binding-like beta-propeller repeat protein [bacterium]